MTKSAREVIADTHWDVFENEIGPFIADRIAGNLEAHGYAIVPKEPSEAMIGAGSNFLFEASEDAMFGEVAEKTYRAMLLTAQKEG